MRQAPFRLRLSFATAAAFILAGAGLIVIINAIMRQQALAEAEEKALILLNRNLATHTFFTRQLKPAIFKLTGPNRSADYFDPTWMSSTHALIEIDTYFQDLSEADYYIKDAVINARDPHNEADEYEAAYLARLREDPNTPIQAAVSSIDGQPYFTVLRPGETLEEVCLPCHSEPSDAPGELVEMYGDERGFHRQDQVGQVISTVSIRIPLAQAFRSANQVSALLSGVLLAVLAGLYAVQSWNQRRLVLTPLSNLASRARQISTGEGRGEQLPVSSGGELAELAEAINTLSAAEERLHQRASELYDERLLLQQDLARRTQSEAELIEALRQKDLLLKEVYHRVKNNLQVILSLINLQMSRFEDPAVQQLFAETQSRVFTMALVHEELYRTEDLAHIDFKIMLNRLMPVLFQAYRVNPNVQLDLQITGLDPAGRPISNGGSLPLSPEKAIPCGLVVNELVSNALKHAFPGTRLGVVRVTLRPLDGSLELVVADDGVGLPASVEFDVADTLGLQIVRMLAKQLRGQISLTRNNGTKFTLVFPIN